MIKDRLKALRVENNLTQADMAKILGVKQVTYSTYELGTRDMGTDKIIALAKHFGITTDYLYGVDTEDFTPAETSIIKKYRQIDDYGKKAVVSVLDVEYNRCTSQQPIKMVARSVDNNETLSYIENNGIESATKNDTDL